MLQQQRMGAGMGYAKYYPTLTMSLTRQEMRKRAKYAPASAQAPGLVQVALKISFIPTWSSSQKRHHHPPNGHPPSKPLEAWLKAVCTPSRSESSLPPLMACAWGP
eukprot:1162030-Pelagomonas_calceolata.AAC.2